MKSIFAIVIAFATFCSCKKEAIKYTTKNLTVENFSKLNISNNAEIYVTKGTAYSIQITGKINDVNELQTSITNGELKIGYSNTEIRDRLLVKITMPSLVKFNFSANCNFEINGFNESQIVEANISSNSIGSANMNATEFNLNIQQNSALTVTGNAEKIKCNVYGNALLNTYGVQAKFGEAIVNGNSEVKLFTSEVLNASSSGNSIVYFKGNPGSKFFTELDNSRIIEQ